MPFLTDYSTLKPQELDRRRAIVDALMGRAATGQPQNFGVGLATLGSAIAGRIGDHRLRPHEENARQDAAQTFGGILREMGFSGFGTGGGRHYGSPAAPRAPETPPGFNIDPNRTAGLHSFGGPPRRVAKHVIT